MAALFGKRNKPRPKRTFRSISPRSQQRARAPHWSSASFFDGTWNNAFNAQKGGGEGSYAVAPTNVYYLSQRYKNGSNFDIVNENGTGVCRKFHSEYVRGVGTVTGEDDSLIGGAVGMGATGVEATVARTALRIGQIIDTLSPGIEPDEIILDVFGFSRGAAAARYCVNAFRQGWVDHNPIFGDRIRGRLPEDRDVKIRFLGIFDTVASIGLGFVEYNWGVNIHLDESKQTTGGMFHITADHESRVNFRLNEAMPGGGLQHGMPGAHGDIGGSYKTPGDLAPLTPLHTYQNPTRGFAEGTRSRLRDAPVTSNPRWVTDGWVNANEVDQAFQRTVSTITPRTIPGPMGVPMISYEVTSAVYLNRPWVKLGLSTVAMHAMHEHARRHQVPFLDLPASAAYRVPEDLQPLVPMVVYGQRPPLAYSRHILHDYGHVSANSQSTGMEGQSDGDACYTTIARAKRFDLVLQQQVFDFAHAF